MALFYLENDMARAFAKAFYNSKEWKVVREYVLKRDNYLCTKCDNPAQYMNTLPKRMQRIIRFRFFEENSWEEVANHMGRNATADSVRMEFERFLKEK